MPKFESRLSYLQFFLCLFGCALIVIDTSLAIAFELKSLAFDPVFDWLTCSLFAVQALLRLRRDKRYYSRSEMGRDVFASLPFGAYFAFHHLEYPLWVHALTALKLIKFKEITNFVRFKREAMELKKSHVALLGLLGIGLAIHSISCMWIFIYPVPEVEFSTIYIKALYYIVTTMATVGYGDITPTTNVGRIFAIGIMIIGVATYSLLVAQMSRLLLENDQRKANSRFKLEVLESFLKHYELPFPLQKSVYGFYNHMLSHQMNDLETEIINSLPSALQGEVKLYMSLKPLAHVSLFKGCDRQCLMDAANHLEHVYYSPGDTIVAKGDVGSEMYVIGHGRVKVEKNNVTVAILSDGDCFGELSLIYDEARQATIVATSYCDLFRLSRASFDHLTQTHTELNDNIQKLVHHRKS